MGGGDLNSKKGWHPSTLKNQERVWKAEKAAAEEQKRIVELERERQLERDRAELNVLARNNAAAGAGASTSAGVPSDDRLHWMYDKPDKKVQQEEYLLGRAIDNNHDNSGKKDADEIPAVSRRVVGSSMLANADDTQVDLARKIREDPLLLVKERERAARAALLNNPVQRARLTELLRKEQVKKNDVKIKNKSKKKDKDLDNVLNEKLQALGGKNGIDLATLLASDDSSSDSSDEKSKQKSKKKKKKSSKSKKKTSNDDESDVEKQSNSKKNVMNKRNNSKKKKRQLSESDDEIKDKKKKGYEREEDHHLTPKCLSSRYKSESKDDKQMRDHSHLKDNGQTKEDRLSNENRQTRDVRMPRDNGQTRDNRQARGDRNSMDGQEIIYDWRRRDGQPVNTKQSTDDRQSKYDRDNYQSRRYLKGEIENERSDEKYPSRSGDGESRKSNKSTGLSEKEKAARLAEMAAAGAERERLRGRRVAEQLAVNNAADNVPRGPRSRNVARELPDSLESRIHSNRHYIQRDQRHMNEHFARR